jgi:putative ABC transport system ATP-binding protein
MGGSPIVRLENIDKVYRMGQVSVSALHGVSISFAQGSFWAIMGPSGSGKTTLLNLIGCLDRPTTGRCVVGGRDVNRLDDNALSDLRLTHLGFIFQDFNLIPGFTVRENLELPMYYRGVGAQVSARRARELAEQVGLGERLEHRPTELSGGQQQRVAIARALANDPPLLLADEPTGNLDSATGEQIMELLAGLQQQGKTLIIVTHDPGVAAHAPQRLYMRDGGIERIEEAAS